MSPAPNLDSRITNSPQQESLTGVVERLTYHSSESGYSVARLKASGHKDLVTIVGSFPNIQAGQTLKLFGFWREHPKFGSQFTVTQYQETKPATLTGMEKYLGSGLIKGVVLQKLIEDRTILINHRSLYCYSENLRHEFSASFNISFCHSFNLSFT